MTSSRSSPASVATEGEARDVDQLDGSITSENKAPASANQALARKGGARVRRVFVLKLEGRRDADGAHIRTLRFLLKHLLRQRGLKCVDAREETADAQEERPS